MQLRETSPHLASCSAPESDDAREGAAQDCDGVRVGVVSRIVMMLGGGDCRIWMMEGGGASGFR